MATRQAEGVPRRFVGVLLRSPRYLLLAANVARDERLSGAQRAGAWIALGYVVSPIDLVPGIIPVAGQLDDMAVLIGGLKTVLRSCPPEVARDHLIRAGVDFKTMDEDLSTLGATAWWLARKGGRLLARAARASARFGLGKVQESVRGVLSGRQPPVPG